MDGEKENVSECCTAGVPTMSACNEHAKTVDRFYTKQWLLDVEKELAKARFLHPKGMNSKHEGFAVLLEEVEEVKQEVFHGRRLDRLRDELIQVAAMAQRMAEDLLL